MSTVLLSAAELAPVVHVISAAFDGARGTMRNLERAAATLAPALTANAREYSATYGDPSDVLTAADLLAVCNRTYCQRNGLARDAKRALKALGSLRYNSGAMLREEQAALLDAYALCARVAADVMSPPGDD